ncbi:alpha/beta hydrolase [Catenovulum adriaticum]|uniref:Alpha/beta hydrolase n=1 Tax=Catenovulum adriaticum TaxID=2984846 RepID=A0ABY7ALG4_9ALTE|nr:alpha/beta hydrolase [Catenovulum sp. TS8]WAJ70398.1 alpha/beta hydrolase [Catenovulum sp. TS8]
MLFATNRTPRESNRSKKNRNISFSKQTTRPTLDMFFCEREHPSKYTEIGSPAFFERLKKLSKNMQILLYIHGFNNTPEEDIFPDAEKLQTLINQLKGEHFALVVPLIWPCDDDCFVAFLDDYWDDQKAADASGLAFARVLSKFDIWRASEAKKVNPCTRRVNILAHSMGNRVLRNAFASWAKHDHRGAAPLLFRNIFMMAPDVVNQCLEPGESAAVLPQCARNLVVYFANDDLAMPASKLANLKCKSVSRRLGMTGLERLDKVPKNVYEVDCDNFNNFFDLKGHHYFTEKNNVISPALTHLLTVMETGRMPSEARSIILAKP